MSRKIKEFRITYHGVDHSQCFQGHGLAFSKYTDCATGIGDSPAEALDDALEQLTQGDWDTSTITDPDFDSEAARKEYAHSGCECQHGVVGGCDASETARRYGAPAGPCRDSYWHEECEMHCFVSVDVIGEEEDKP